MPPLNPLAPQQTVRTYEVAPVQEAIVPTTQNAPQAQMIVNPDAPAPLGVVNNAPVMNTPQLRNGRDGTPEELGRWAEDRRKQQKSVRFEPYTNLFGAGGGGDTPLQTNRRRLIDGYFDGAATNAEAAARVKKLYGDGWDKLSSTDQRKYIADNRTKLWDSMNQSERANFLTSTKAMSELVVTDKNGQIKQKDGRPLTSLDYVESLTDIHGGDAGKKGDPNSPSQLRGNPNGPDMDRDRLGVNYSQEGKDWLMNGGNYRLGGVGDVRQVGHNGPHSTHGGWDGWSSDNGSPNLQWQFRKRDDSGEIDIDYDHHGLYLKAKSAQNSSVVDADHFQEFYKKYGNPGFTMP